MYIEQLELFEESGKDIKGKPKLSLVPYPALVAIANVREFGAKKYKCADNYRTVPSEQFIEAAMRHIGKHFNGELIDDESGLPHIDHAIASLSLAIATRIENVNEVTYGSDS